MNTEELKQKAIAAIRGGDTGSYVDFLNAREVFGQAASPATILALIAERDELLAALKKFGRHEKNCIQKMSSGFASCCTCGLGDIQDKVEG